MQADFLTLILSTIFSCSSVIGSENKRFKIGRWKIHSQSLDGQQLDASQWIVPKFLPNKRSRVLDIFNLENPGHPKTNEEGNGRLKSAGMWFPINGDHQSFLKDDSAQASKVVYSVAEKRVDDGGEKEFVVINNGTGSQVIIISENQEEILTELLQNNSSIQVIGKNTSRPKLNLESFANSEVLEEVLDDLTQEGHIRRLNLLKESLKHKNDIFLSSNLNKENKQLTNVGISLHKQGQVLNHFGTVDPLSHTEEDRKRSQEANKTKLLLDKKKRLQSILSQLKLLVQAKKRLEALQPTLALQEKILSL